MQLKNKNGRRAGLAAATLSLLGAAPTAGADTPNSPQTCTECAATNSLPSPAAAPGPLAHETPWEFDSAVLIYSESDGRVQAAEPVFQVSKNLGDDRLLSGKLVLDMLTGASPNGATPASTPQTFARPSGSGSFTVSPGETPLDDTFRDTRVAVTADYQFPLTSTSKLAIGANASNEYDFFSAGGNLRYSLDLNQRNTTLSAGLSYESDQVDAVGGAPVPLALVPASGPHATITDTGKSVTDVVLGVAQVLDPKSLLQVNYSLSLSSGYQTDPYKLLSVVDPNGEPLRYVYEGRPDSRTKHSLFTRYKRFVVARDVLDVSYRFMTDDWGVVSHTADVTYRWNFRNNQYLEPHLRWYNQSAADFYYVALFDGTENSLESATADPRLGAFDGITAGLKYGYTLKSGNQWNTRLEVYQQSGREAGVPVEAANGLSKFELEPKLSAVMLTFGYRFSW